MSRDSAKRLMEPDLERAESIALQALAFLASEPDRLARFLALTGIGPADLRAAVEKPETLAAVLEHLLGDESLLLIFTSGAQIDPAAIAPAHSVLLAAMHGRSRS